MNEGICPLISFRLFVTTLAGQVGISHVRVLGTAYQSTSAALGGPHPLVMALWVRLR